RDLHEMPQRAEGPVCLPAQRDEGRLRRLPLAARFGEPENARRARRESLPALPSPDVDAGHVVRRRRRSPVAPEYHQLLGRRLSRGRPRLQQQQAPALLTPPATTMNAKFLLSRTAALVAGTVLALPGLGRAAETDALPSF